MLYRRRFRGTLNALNEVLVQVIKHILLFLGKKCSSFMIEVEYCERILNKKKNDCLKDSGIEF